MPRTAVASPPSGPPDLPRTLTAEAGDPQSWRYILPVWAVLALDRTEPRWRDQYVAVLLSEPGLFVVALRGRGVTLQKP